MSMNTPEGGKFMFHATNERPGFRFALITTVLALSFAGGTVTVAAPQEAEQEVFTAVAQHLGTGPGGQTRVQFTITRWSTEEERQQLLTTLANEGSDALIDALQDQEEVGFMRATGQGARRGPSDRLKYSRQVPEGDSGRHIILAADQELLIFALRGSPRTRGQMFTLLDIHLDENNEGEGTMWLTARLGYDADANTLTIQSLSSEPIRLTNIRRID